MSPRPCQHSARRRITTVCLWPELLTVVSTRFRVYPGYCRSQNSASSMYIVLASSIAGTVTVKAASAVLKGNFTISGGTLEIAGNITDETAGASKITVSGTAALTVKGDTAANVTATDSATVTVEGEATGTITNEGTGTVTVGDEAIAKPEEVTEDIPDDDPPLGDQPDEPGLPQTGQQWLLAGLLAAAGAALVVTGLWYKTRYRGKHEA